MSWLKHIGKQAFLSHSLRFICKIGRVLLKLYFSVNFSAILWFLFQRKVKKIIWDDSKICLSCFNDSSPWSQFYITKAGHLFLVGSMLCCAFWTVIYKLKKDRQWFELLVLLIPPNHLKNLKEPEWKKYGMLIQNW